MSKYVYVNYFLKKSTTHLNAPKNYQFNYARNVNSLELILLIHAYVFFF